MFNINPQFQKFEVNFQQPKQNTFKINFQYRNENNDPLSFTINKDLVVMDWVYKAPQQVNFVLVNEVFIEPIKELNILFPYFIEALYGKNTQQNLQNDSKYYLPLLKLSIFFKCKNLVEDLMKNKSDQLLKRSIFMGILIFIMKEDSICRKMDQNTVDNFIENLIIINCEYIISHINWDETRINQMKQSIQQLTPQMFKKISTILIKYEKQHVLIFLTWYACQYQNIYNNIFEDICSATLIPYVNEDLLIRFDKVFSERLKKLLNNNKQKILEQNIIHYIHSKTCDLVGKSFIAKCGHQICTNCLYEYTQQKLGIKNQYPFLKVKIRCLARQLDPELCQAELTIQDLQQIQDICPEIVKQYQEQ